jgi:hypothetical protein
MPLRFHHRLVALATAVLFVLSIAGHGVMMAEMTAKAVAAASDMAVQSPSADCDGGCGGNDTDMQTTCFAHCASAVGIVSEAVELPIRAAVREAPLPAVSSLSGRTGPPDPYPPKPSVLI